MSCLEAKDNCVMHSHVQRKRAVIGRDQGPKQDFVLELLLFCFVLF